MRTAKLSPRSAELLLALVISARATSYLFSKLILGGMGLFNLLAIRFLLGFALLAALFFRRLKGIDRKTLFAGIAMGLLYFLTMTAELNGLMRTSTSSISFLENTAIVWVPLISACMARRFPERKTLIGAILCLLGVGMLTLGGGMELNAGTLWGLAAALLYAAAILTTDRLTHRGIDALGAGIVQVGTIGALGLIASLLTEAPRLPAGGTEWLGILLLAVVCTGFGFTLQPVAQSGTTAERAGMFCALNPLVASVLGAAVLHETFSPGSLVGGLLILGGILFCCAPPLRGRKRLMTS